jgi:hypothetical protein
MNDVIFYAIAGTIAGTIFVTFWNFLWKKVYREITFNLTYLYTMLISAIISMSILPLFLINNALPINSNLFVVIATASMSGLLNIVANTPIAYLMSRHEELKTLLSAAKISIPSVSVTTSKAKAAFTAVIIVVLVFALAGTAVFAAVTYSKTLNSTGSITAVGNLAIFSDSTGQTSVNTINWGNIEPGASITTTLYVKNTGNVPMSFAIATAAYTPSVMSQYLTLTWDYITGTSVQAGNLIKVDMTMATSTASPGGTFTLQIIITGTTA